MAVITLTVPDAQLTRVVTALCARGVRPSPGMPPVQVAATAANARAVAVDWVKEVVLAYENAQVQVALPVIDVSGVVS